MIQIRGKRKRGSSSNTTHTPRSRGRPLKRQSQSSPSQKSRILLELEQYHRSQKPCKMDFEVTKLSPLEQLPVELIQQVFFHALEVNMPRASVNLQKILSTDAIFSALILLAYFDDDGDSPVETKHFLPGEYRILSSLEKVRLQESIFSCRWCTYERTVSCLPTLSRLAMVQAWHREDTMDSMLSQDQEETVAKSSFVVANEAIRELANLPSLSNEAELERHFLARTKFENLGSSQSFERSREPGDCLPRIVTWKSSLDDNGRIHKSTDASVSVLATRHIPSWLLRGKGLTGTKLALLQLLRQGYTFIQEDHIMSISAKAVFDGMRAAIQEANLVGLKTLLELHNVMFKSGEWTIRNMMASQLTPATHHPLPIDLFHLSVKQQTGSSETISLLLRAGIDALPRDDEVVTAWAVYKAQQGDPLAKWLLTHMDGSASYGLPRRGHLFVDGCLSWRARARHHFPFSETRFDTELGYLTGTPIVPSGLEGRPCGTDKRDRTRYQLSDTATIVSQ